jgi:hypothetical protein
MCNDQISPNFCILSINNNNNNNNNNKLDQSNPSCEIFLKEKKQCSNKRKFVWTKGLNHILINIKDNNSLSTIQQTTLAF